MSKNIKLTSIVLIVLFSFFVLLKGLDKSNTYSPELSTTKIDFNFKAYYKLNYGRIWAGLSFRNSLEGAEYIKKYDDVTGSEGTLMEQNLQLITPLFGIDYKDFVFSYNYSYQFGDVNFGSGGFHQITIGFNFLRGSIECDCF